MNDNRTLPDDDDLAFDLWANSEEGQQWHWDTSEALAAGKPVHADDQFGITDQSYLLDVVKTWAKQEWRTLDTELKRRGSEAWDELADSSAALAMQDTHEHRMTAERAQSAYMEVIWKLADQYADKMARPYWRKYVLPKMTKMGGAA